jgi:hypothetical protein
MTAFERSTLRWAKLAVFMSALAALFVCAQWYEMHSSSGDTHDLAVAAKAQADASKAIAVATGKQADSTAQQVQELDASVRQATRLAKATEAANGNVLNSDRPWMGVGLAVDGFEVGKTPKATLAFFNSGKRPGRVTVTQYRWTMYSEFPKIVSYPPSSTEQSTNIVLPNARADVSFTLDAVTDQMMQLIKAGTATMYVHANVEYDDPVTRQHHRTHACWQYIYFEKGISPGFYNCLGIPDDGDHRFRAIVIAVPG